MKLHDDPAKVFALVVGIEAYGDGVNELSGPGADALSFCGWLLDWGVTAKNIRCCVNFCRKTLSASDRPMAELLARIRTAGVHLGDNPTRATIENELSDRQLLKHCAPHNSAFYLYWSGHGLMSHVHRERVLLTSDATEGDLAAIRIEDQTSFLRLSPALRCFASQLVIVDACAQYTAPNVAVKALSLQLSHYREQGREQERVYACTDGQIALIKSGDRLSQFTQHLLDALPRKQAASVHLDEIWESLQRTLKAKGAPLSVERVAANGSR